MAKARFGALVAEAHGATGNAIIVSMRSGPAVRRRPRYGRPTAPAQQVTQDRMSQAMATWNTLTYAQAAAWRAYAAGLRRVNTTTGETYTPTGQNTFVALATRFLQVNSMGTVPLNPPAGPFSLDDPVLGAAGLPGMIEFHPSGPNAPGHTTELLLQPLANARRTPGPFYKSVEFTVIAPGTIAIILTPGPGWYACAYRFVEIATGRAGELLTLGVVQVT